MSGSESLRKVSLTSEKTVNYKAPRWSVGRPAIERLYDIPHDYKGSLKVPEGTIGIQEIVFTDKENGQWIVYLKKKNGYRVPASVDRREVSEKIDLRKQLGL